MCTSFVVYGNNPLYGMNIDHFEEERKFKITKIKCDHSCNDKSKCSSCYLNSNDMLRFHSQGKENGRFLDGACMNGCGLFTNYQYLVQDNFNSFKSKTRRTSAHSLFTYSQMYCKSVAEVKENFNSKQVYFDHIDNFSLHSMYADRYGNAFILEESEQGTELTENSKNYLVMTNFPIYQFADNSDLDVVGDGADRYILTCTELEKEMTSFTVNDAFSLLKQTSRFSGNYPTVCSMVFDPVNLVVYITLFGDFEKIWKVSINKAIIETYQGFKNSVRIKLGSKGIFASELKQYY